MVAGKNNKKSMKKSKIKKARKKSVSGRKKKTASKKAVKRTKSRKKLISRPKEKKVSVSERKTRDLLHLADTLTEKGKKRGFITYDEILKTFPDIEKNILFLDELYEKFSVAGVDVL